MSNSPTILDSPSSDLLRWKDDLSRKWRKNNDILRFEKGWEDDVDNWRELLISRNQLRNIIKKSNPKKAASSNSIGYGILSAA